MLLLAYFYDFDWGYAYSGVIISKKFINIANLFSVIYVAGGIFPNDLTKGMPKVT